MKFEGAFLVASLTVLTYATAERVMAPLAYALSLARLVWEVTKSVMVYRPNTDPNLVAFRHGFTNLLPLLRLHAIRPRWASQGTSGPSLCTPVGLNMGH